jgi:hypothetical protein
MFDPAFPSATTNTSSGSDCQEEMRLKAKMEEKKLLQARIEEKKRQLLVRKQRKSQTKETSLNVGAAPFVPNSSHSTKETEKKVNQRKNVRSVQHVQDNSATQSLLPANIRSTADLGKSDKGKSIALTEKDYREDLENAVSLVGTCQYMCPDDELIRRERESDIQQLETPQPGTLHPQHWSLRDTVVKRFRRSAADYKLDVPEWVRPPDVLERVCSYLEEWVMVSHLGGYVSATLCFTWTHLGTFPVVGSRSTRSRPALPTEPNPTLFGRIPIHMGQNAHGP